MYTIATMPVDNCFSFGSHCLYYPDIVSHLKDYGVSYQGSPSQSADSQSTKLILQPKLFPAVSYYKPFDCFVLYFQLPGRQGEQKFYFDPCFEFDIQKPSLNKKDRPAQCVVSFFDNPTLSFDELKSICIDFIAYFFSITPTVLNTAKHQNKKKHRRVILQPKPATIKKALGIYVPPFQFSDKPFSIVDGRRVYHRKKLQLPDFADYYVELAAKDYDFNWFTPFWNEYIASKGRKAVKRREREKLEELFKDRVLSLQGRKESV